MAARTRAAPSRSTTKPIQLSMSIPDSKFDDDLIASPGHDDADGSSRPTGIGQNQLISAGSAPVSYRPPDTGRRSATLAIVISWVGR